jgi:hypothetical protein
VERWNSLLPSAIAIAALIIVLFEPIAAANLCADLPKTALDIDVHDPEPIIDTTKSLGELDNMAASQFSQDKARPHRLMVVTVDLVYRAHTDGRVIGD